MIVATELSKTFVRRTGAEKGRIFSRGRSEEFHAVRDISFSAEKGEIFGVLGPNGAGKTTLLRMLGGILTPSAGNVTVCGMPHFTQDNRAKRSIGYISGNTRLYGRLTPRELLGIFGRLYGMNDGEITRRTAEIIGILDMGAFCDNRIERLSTGQTQRASIARCLIHSPSVYIFDEPTLGLDVLSSRAIIDFMRSEGRAGKTVVYSTHYMEEAQTLCGRILMLHGGEELASGTPDELMKRAGETNLRDAFISLISQKGGASL